jgi:hypothetical protein
MTFEQAAAPSATASAINSVESGDSRASGTGL